jgi:hypothetical protein
VLGCGNGVAKGGAAESDVEQDAKTSDEDELAGGVEGGVEAQLEHSYIRQREEVAQHRPGAVVEPPGMVLGKWVGVGNGVPLPPNPGFWRAEYSPHSVHKESR